MGEDAPLDRSRKIECRGEETLGRGKSRIIINYNCDPWPSQVFAEGHTMEMQEWLSDTLGILCFATNRDNLLMWAHYTSSHTGYAIEFDSEHAEFKALGELIEVSYSTDRPQYDIRDSTDISPLRSKSQEWAYEGEYRCSRLLKECREYKVDGKTLYVRDFPLGAVTAIYFGIRSAPSLALTIRKLLGERPIKYFRGYPDPYNFAILWHPIHWFPAQLGLVISSR